MNIRHVLLSMILASGIGLGGPPAAATEVCTTTFGDLGLPLTYAGNAPNAAPFMDAVLALGEELGPAGVLVVLDIDNTLLAGIDDLGSDQWYRWQKQLLEQPGPDPGEVAPDFDGMLTMQRFLFAARPMRPTEPDMAEAVRALQDLGFPVLALTARDPQTIGATDRELTRNGFDLTRTAPVAPAALAEAAIPLDPADPTAVGLTPEEITAFGLQVPRPVMYRDGLYMVAGQHKGAMLRILLHRLGTQVGAIAYLDDRDSHICEMAAAYAGQPIELSAWRYDRERASALGFLEDAERQHTATRDWGLMTAGLAPLCAAVPEHCTVPVADVGVPVTPDPEPPPISPIAIPERPLRITTWNLEHMMSEAVFADWVAACAPHDWDDEAARAEGKPPTLTYCNAHSGMDWPCADRREALALRTPEAFDEKVEALRARATELDADIYAFQEVSDAAAVARILPPDTYEIFFAPAEIAMNVAFAVKRELAPAVAVEPLEALSVCAVSDRLDPADPARCIEGSYRTRPGLVLNLSAGEQTLSLLNVHLKSSCRGHPVSAPQLERLSASACRAPDFDQDAANATYRASVANGCGLLRDQVPAVEGWIEAQARAGRDFMVLGDFNRDFIRELREGMPARLDGTAARDPILPGTAIGSILKEWSDNVPEGTYLYLVRQDIDGRDRTCRAEDGGTYRVRTCHKGIDHFLIGKQWAEAVSEDPRSLRASGRDYGDAGYCAEHARPSDHCPVTLEIPLPSAAQIPAVPEPPPVTEPVPLAPSGPPQPPGELTGEALRDWLREHWYQGHHRTLGYNAARRAMYTHIDVAADGRVYGVYSGFSQPARETTFLDPINAEHTVPQSFFGRSDPMLSDIHHLFPTHKDVNSARGSDPFGEIPDTDTTRWYGLTPDGALARLSSPPETDRDAYSEDRPDVFEPREVHEGDAARAVLYFYTMYPGRAGSLDRITRNAPEVLGVWHRIDPPDDRERQRNERIEAVQGNRNPFIDHPELVCRAWGLGCP